MRPIVASALALGVIVAASSALAQQAVPTAAQNQQTTTTTTTTTTSTPRIGADPKDPGPSGGGGGGGSGASGGTKEQGSTYGQGGQGAGNMGGYSYDDKPRRGSATAATPKARVVKKHNGPVVNLPGFEQTPDGGSRVFVSLTSSVPVEEHKAQGSVTYVLKGAGVRVFNNTRPLVTVHFNTPVSKAHLVPHGNDAHLVIDLRAASTPTYKMTEGQDKTAVLQVDFPKGDFAPADNGEGPALNVNSGNGDEGDAPAKKPNSGTPPVPKKKGAPKPAAGTKPGPTP